MALVLSKTKKICLMVCVTLAYIAWGLLLSLQPAFYPTEAESKGATPSQYGFVFGVVSLAAFLFSPLFAHYGNAIGPKLLYNTGGYVQGVGGILFGLLDYVNNTGWFIGLSYLLRFLEGVANAACTATMLGILIQLFPERVSAITAWTEMSLGLGYMFGPSVGSVFYSIAGFGLPFYVVGAGVTVLATALLVLVPKPKDLKKAYEEDQPRSSSADGRHQQDRTDERSRLLEEDGDFLAEKPSLTLKRVLQTPAMWLPYVDNFMCFSGNGMIEAMIEPHLKNDAGASQSDVAITFLILGGCYMLTTPVVGFLSDRVRHRVGISVAGNCLMAVCFVFLGPLPFLPIQPSVGLIYACVAMAGVGYGLVLVSTFGRAHRQAMNRGYANDMATSLIISGLWTASFHLGNFVGPTASGFMVEAWGFRSTTTVFIVVFLIMALVDVSELCYHVGADRKKNREGYQDMQQLDK